MRLHAHHAEIDRPKKRRLYNPLKEHDHSEHHHDGVVPDGHTHADHHKSSLWFLKRAKENGP